MILPYTMTSIGLPVPKDRVILKTVVDALIIVTRPAQIIVHKINSEPLISRLLYLKKVLLQAKRAKITTIVSKSSMLSYHLPPKHFTKNPKSSQRTLTITQRHITIMHSNRNLLVPPTFLFNNLYYFRCVLHPVRSYLKISCT